MHSPTYKHKVTVAFRSEEVLWRLTYYGPALDLPLGGFGQKSIQMCGVMSTLSLPSLVNIQ